MPSRDTPAVESAPTAVALEVTHGPMIELRVWLDDDLDEVVDFIAEQQELHGRRLWPRDGIRLHTGNPYGRDAMARTIRRYAERGGIGYRQTLSPGGKPVFEFEIGSTDGGDE